jgi:Na+/H+-translocating membrane pyrophosphatase
MRNISHEEIVEKFVNSKSVDFAALGKFVAEYGSQIAVSSRGDYGVRIGFYNILACFNIIPTIGTFGPIGKGASGIASEVAGGG